MIEIDTSWEWIAIYGPGGTVRYSIVQYSTVLYSTLQYNTVYIGPYSSKFMIDTTVDNNGNNW